MDQRNNQNLQYCLLYRGEPKSPFHYKDYENRVWTAEMQANERPLMSSEDFLDFICARLDREGSCNCSSYAARYIFEFHGCSVQYKVRLAQVYRLDEFLTVKKPKGRMIYEHIVEGGESRIRNGVQLYFDGRIYRVGWNLESFGVDLYLREDVSKQIADTVKALIKDNWPIISLLPAKAENWSILDGSTSYYKFLSKHCYGYMLEESFDGQPIVEWSIRIADIFRKYRHPIDELTFSDFADRWLPLIQNIKQDKTHRLVYDFIESEEFSLDCRELNFDLDGGDAYRNQFGDESYKRLMKDPSRALFDEIEDPAIIGNLVFSRWRYYNHWAYDGASEFQPDFFILALERLVELDN